jgi:hypothetical protein
MFKKIIPVKPFSAFSSWRKPQFFNLLNSPSTYPFELCHNTYLKTHANGSNCIHLSFNPRSHLVGLLSKLSTNHLIVCTETLRKIAGSNEQTLLTCNTSLLENLLLLGRTTLWWISGKYFLMTVREMGMVQDYVQSQGLVSSVNFWDQPSQY